MPLADTLAKLSTQSKFGTKKIIYILSYSAAIYIDFKCFEALQAEYVRYALSSGAPNRYMSEWCGWTPTYPFRV